MKLALNHRLLSQQSIPPVDARTLLDTAQALRRAAEAGLAQPLLKDKNIALLCRDDACVAAAAFTHAAEALGARVSRVQPDEALLAVDDAGIAQTARMLGKLYDAVECDELPAEVALNLQREVGVPVYNGLGRPDHPVAALLADLPASTDPDADRAFLMQAVLVNTIS